MNKKIFIFSLALAGISIAESISLSVANVSASSILTTISSAKAEGKQTWTLPEMQNLSIALEQELAEYCKTAAEYYECENDRIMKLSEEDEIYRAIEEYDFRNLIVTSVNPGRGTLKVLYKEGTDRMLLRFMDDTADEPPATLANIYLARFDDGYKTYSITDDVIEHTKAAVHLSFKGVASELGNNWLPLDTERELAVENLAITPTIQNALFYIATDSRNSTSSGFFDYSSCVVSPDYYSGAECQYVFSYGTGWHYVLVTEDDTDVDTSEFAADAENGDTFSGYPEEGIDGTSPDDSVEAAFFSGNNISGSRGLYSSLDTSSAVQTASPEETRRSGTYISDTAQLSSEQSDTGNNIPSSATNESFSAEKTLETASYDTKGQEAGTRNSIIRWQFFAGTLIGLVGILIWWLFPTGNRRSKNQESSGVVEE